MVHDTYYIRFTVYYIWFAKNWVGMGAGVPQDDQEEEGAILKRPLQNIWVWIKRNWSEREWNVTFLSSESIEKFRLNLIEKPIECKHRKRS